MKSIFEMHPAHRQSFCFASFSLQAKRLRLSVLAVYCICALVLMAPAILAQEHKGPALPERFQENGKWGYRDHQGKVIIQSKYDSVCSFSEGMAAVALNNKWGYIDIHGKVIVAPKYQYADYFQEGRGRVRLGPLYGFVDHNGKVVIALKYTLAQPFQDGLAIIKQKGKYGFIDRSGHTVIEPVYTEVNVFSEGLAAIRVGKNNWTGGNWGFIDYSGKVVIKPQASFKYVRVFSEGLAAVMVGNQWGYIDTLGKMVIQPGFDMAGNFENGYALVKIRQPAVDATFFDCMYIDIKGNQVSEILIEELSNK